MESMQGTVALVTGAGAGIGRATACWLAEAGAQVAAADLDKSTAEETVKRVQEAGGTATAWEVDVSDEAAVADLIASVVDTLGPIGAACNVAGVAGQRGRIAEYPTDGWDRVMSINLRGAWLCMKHEIRHMREAGGAIVNVASVFGQVGLRGAAARVAADHGVVGLTKAAALEYADEGIRVNAVSPSFVETELQVRTGALIHPERRQEAMQAHPMARFARPEEIAEAIGWLCSPASSFVTGHTLTVDGGYTAR